MPIDLYTISVWVLPVLLAITLHEAAHGFVAWRLGDDTAYRLGRVSANPFRHIDPFGTVILPGLLILSGSPFLFGYAKPVPVQFRNLRQPRRDSILVAAAGPAANLVLALASALLIRAALVLPGEAQAWSGQTLINSILLNVSLAVLNLLPIPPLDGSRVLLGLLPRPLAQAYAQLFRYGLFLVVGLILVPPLIGQMLGIDLNIIGWMMGPPVKYLLQILTPITGLA
ncbi:MAG: site-2 protease family protein [Dongiaceae bacterium]